MGKCLEWDVRGADFLWLISVSMRIRIPLMEEEEYEAKKLPRNVQSWL